MIRQNMIGRIFFDYEGSSKERLALAEFLYVLELMSYILLLATLVVDGHYILFACMFFVPLFYFIFNDNVTIIDAIKITKEYITYLLREKIINILETGKITNNGNGTASITYFRADDRYKILIPTKRGPKPIKNITIESDSCGLLKLINEYAGPSRDFHGISVTPALLGVNQPIVVTYSNGVVKTYDVDDVINVTLPIEIH